MTVFWQTKSLEQLSSSEWEQLCDGCGKCCLHKLEDEDTGELFFTRVACFLFDDQRCQCQDYPNRKQRVPECLVLSSLQTEQFDWLPETCAYRLLAYHQPLPSWHPLVSGDTETVHRAGISARGKTINEHDVDLEQLEDHIVHWV